MLLITAHKRSLRRLCFHRCLSVHRGEGHVWHAHPLDTHAPGTHAPLPQACTPLGTHPPRHAPPGMHALPWHARPLGMHAPPPRQACPPGIHAPWAGKLSPPPNGGYYEMCSMILFWHVNSFLYFIMSLNFCLIYLLTMTTKRFQSVQL